MFKKALQIAVTFSLLLGSYAGYTRLFLLATYVLGAGQGEEVTAFAESDTKSAKKAAKLAREAFGPDFWASKNDLKLNYNEEQRGYFIYSQNYELSNERKTVKLTPFALVWVSADGKSYKSATSDIAFIEMSQPFGNLKPEAKPSKITHVTLLGNVKFRDDKGTRDDPTDDLRVSQMERVDYDEATLQITSDSSLLLEDRNMTLTGLGMMIQLRRKQVYINPNLPTIGGGSGFDAETAFVYKDVHIVMLNAGRTGLMPGKAKPSKTGNTPTDVRADGSPSRPAMRIDLPPPRPKLLVGPPYLNRPADPTLCTFEVNFRVVRGTDKPDQLTGDKLDLTLLPKPRPDDLGEADYFEDYDEAILALSTENPEGSVDPSASGSSGPMSDLQLHKAVARGDAVWIQSELQGLNARCVELIHEKHDDGSPDSTYLNGGLSKKLYVERTEFDSKSPIPGTIKSFTVMRAQDATIFDYGPGGTSRVIARGPGRADERPAKNAPVQRTVFWEDEMDLITWRSDEAAMPSPHVEAARPLYDRRLLTPPKGTLRRVITLTGVSKLIDYGKATGNDAGQTTTLDAKRAIVAEFQARQIADLKIDPNADPKAPLRPVDGPNEIKWLDAFQDAHLTAPSKVLTAREFLKAKFEPLPPTTTAPAVGLLAPGSGPVIAGGPAPVATTAPALAEAQPDRGPSKVEPPVDGRADRIWATLVLGAPGGKAELKNAMLRGGVMVHQEPGPNETFPTEASGEAIDLTGQGKGLMEFKVQREEEPQAFDPKTKLASKSNGRRVITMDMARVNANGRVIEAENIIGLNQKVDFAWVEGPGVYSQMTDRGLLDDKGLEVITSPTNPKSNGPNPKDKIVISWNDSMRFYGHSRNLDGKAVAKIEFRGTTMAVRTPDGKTEFRRGVDARMPESRLEGDYMDVYMDKTIDLSKDTRKGPKRPDEPKEPDPQIALIDVMGKNIVENDKLKVPGVVVINVKYIPGTKDLKEKQRIQGVWIIYDKMTGQFSAEGPGITWLYQRDAGYDLILLPTMKDLGDIPREGKKQIYVAQIGKSLHFRMFDGNGNIVVDSGERTLRVPAQQLDELKRRLTGLWPNHELTPDEKGQLLPKVASVIGQTREVIEAPLPPLKLTKVKYVDGMEGRFGVARDKPGDQQEREAVFNGSAQAANATVLTGNGDISFDDPRAKDYVFLTSDVIHVFTLPRLDGTKGGARQLLKARGNGVARTIDSLVTADRITYNSSTELLYAYGEDDKEVLLTQQGSPGQLPSYSRGKMLRYNKQTRASDLQDPQTIVFTDLKTGFRPKPYYPELGGSGKPFELPKQQRLPFMRSQRSSTERKQFTGN